MAKNIFVLGLDDLNAETLRALPHAEDYRFHRLLAKEELLTDEIRLPELLAAAERQLYHFDDTIDAIVGYWDFPVSSLVPILCERFGTTGPSLESVVKCEHKYWSRLEQQKVIAEHPAFGLIDPKTDTRPPEELSYPMWIKPVKSTSSALAFRVRNDHEFASAVETISEGIDWMGAPFEQVLEHLHPPPEIAGSGRYCLVEEDVSGEQLTVEGYVQGDKVHIYGIVASINYPDTSSFLRYEYPAAIPPHVAGRLEEVTRRVIIQSGLDNSTLNIEFFWDPAKDTINVLEVNPRHSQSHARLFQMVDGVSNHYPMVRLALNRDPDLPHRQGEHAVAAKWFLRRFADGLTTRVPTHDEIAHVQWENPDATVRVIAHEGRWLSDLTHQDSYSYELAQIFIGAQSQEELIAKYERCVEALPFKFDTSPPRGE
ncbi:ATP-grasp domain-containing protein [Phytoactinopolyspora halotolerans]|uniref:ATP-grasp domain-containing protein n=1 Tax=Phytoactinopolyspora halotolerans TaxID=1981512 RepID=A0A6L9S5I4_9ACTN|nr:ATP-grasp domain-containing protein [Phytoactinopolyspora halotolerans]NED99339.1 ATP-grasp domain-containing protein [Phytoactinopolyspora halotolerans]